MRLGKHIRALRTTRGFKQEYLAQAAGVSQGKISRIENGNLQPTFEEMVAIARALECSLERFADDDLSSGPKAAGTVSE